MFHCKSLIGLSSFGLGPDRKSRCRVSAGLGNILPFTSRGYHSARELLYQSFRAGLYIGTIKDRGYMKKTRNVLGAPASYRRHHFITMDHIWESWIDNTISDLRTRSLLRSQRPILPIMSSREVRIDETINLFEIPAIRIVSAQALIPESDLRAWAMGAPQSVVGTYNDASSSSPNLSRLTLFSHNDYLGLASHPEVCQAAAETARKVRIQTMCNKPAVHNRCSAPRVLKPLPLRWAWGPAAAPSWAERQPCTGISSVPWLT